MTPNYFYGNEAEQFSFYRIPKVLFTDSRYQEISAESKILYGILLDRMSLSAKNKWLDKEGRVYIIFTVDDIMTAMGCGNQKAGRLLSELEKKADLIERKRQGLGKPNLIYVKRFLPSPSSHIQKCENNTSADVKTTPHEMLESHGNNTENIQTESNKTESLPFPSVREQPPKRREKTDWKHYEEIIKRNIGYEILRENHPFDEDTLQEILGLMVDTVCTSKQTIRISGDDKPAEVVRSVFLNMNGQHITSVLDGLSQNTTRIRNIKQYLLASLYNAPLTMNLDSQNWANHDIAQNTMQPAGHACGFNF